MPVLRRDAFGLHSRQNAALGNPDSRQRHGVPAAETAVLPVFIRVSRRHGEYEAVLNFAAKTAVPVRGTQPFPDNLSFEFVEGGK